MKLPGIIAFAACSLASMGGARPETPGAVPLSRLNGKMADMQTTSSAPAGVRRVSSLQAPVAAARAVAEDRAGGEAKATQPRLNRFGLRPTRADKSIRPTASFTPSAQRATLRR